MNGLFPGAGPEGPDAWGDDEDTVADKLTPDSAPLVAPPMPQAARAMPDNLPTDPSRTSRGTVAYFDHEGLPQGGYELLLAQYRRLNPPEAGKLEIQNLPDLPGSPSDDDGFNMSAFDEMFRFVEDDPNTRSEPTAPTRPDQGLPVPIVRGKPAQPINDGPVTADNLFASVSLPETVLSKYALVADLETQEVASDVHAAPTPAPVRTQGLPPAESRPFAEPGPAPTTASISISADLPSPKTPGALEKLYSGIQAARDWLKRLFRP
ncbi:hypothetical protein IPJ72_00140 [Candidatus Peregrinibacteria bacterium]|nr:MAG: hypothetical protein IPJ72_00140 [Candidatus Peregrinibacteria bacterium]